MSLEDEAVARSVAIIALITAKIGEFELDGLSLILNSHDDFIAG